MGKGGCDLCGGSGGRQNQHYHQQQTSQTSCLSCAGCCGVGACMCCGGGSGCFHCGSCGCPCFAGAACAGLFEVYVYFWAAMIGMMVCGLALILILVGNYNQLDGPNNIVVIVGLLPEIMIMIMILIACCMFCCGNYNDVQHWFFDIAIRRTLMAIFGILCIGGIAIAIWQMNGRPSENWMCTFVIIKNCIYGFFLIWAWIYDVQQQDYWLGGSRYAVPEGHNHPNTYYGGSAPGAPQASAPMGHPVHQQQQPQRHHQPAPAPVQHVQHAPPPQQQPYSQPQQYQPQPVQPQQQQGYGSPAPATNPAYGAPQHQQQQPMHSPQQQQPQQQSGGGGILGAIGGVGKKVGGALFGNKNQQQQQQQQQQQGQHGQQQQYQ